MTRIAHLQPHYPDSELKNRYLQATDRVEARRWHLLWLISKRKSIKEAAAVIGINYDYAKSIVSSYNQQGEKGIIKGKQGFRKRPGHALLNAQQLEELRLSLQEESPDKGIWTGPKVAEWIAKKTGKEKVWAQRGWDYLKACRYSPQKPRPRHQKGDELEQKEFKKN